MAAEGIVTMTNLHSGNSRCTCLNPLSLHYEETRMLGHAVWCPLMQQGTEPEPESTSTSGPCAKDVEIARLQEKLRKINADVNDFSEDREVRHMALVTAVEKALACTPLTFDEAVSAIQDVADWRKRQETRNWDMSVENEDLKRTNEALRSTLEKQVKLSFAAGWRACNKVNEFPWNETTKDLLEADWQKYAKARARKDTK